MWFVSCRNFFFLFGLFPILSHCIPSSQSVSGFCFCFCMPQRFLLTYGCRFVSTFERLLLQQATFKAFKVSFFIFLFSMWLTSQVFIFILTSSQLQTHPHFIFQCSSASIGFYKVTLSMVIMVFDFCSIMKHVERKTFLDDVKVVVNK